MVVTSPAVGSQDTKSVTPETKTGAQLKKPPTVTQPPEPQASSSTSKPAEPPKNPVPLTTTNRVTSSPPPTAPKDVPLAPPPPPAPTALPTSTDQHLPPQPPNLPLPLPKPDTTKPPIPSGEDLDPNTQPPLLPLPTIPYFRSPRSQPRPLPLQPQPPASGLSLPPGNAGPPPSRAEPGQGKAAESQLAGPGVVPPAVGAAAGEAAKGQVAGAVPLVADEEGALPVSDAERAKFGYWRPSRAGAGKFAEGLEKVREVTGGDVEGLFGEEKPVMPVAEMGYWGSRRARSPKGFWAGTKGLVEGVEGGVTKVVGELEDVVEDEASRVVDPAKIAHWRHGRVTDPAKFAPAAIAGRSAAVVEGAMKAIPDIALPAGKEAKKVQQAVISAHRAASEYSPSEYSDYRSDPISFHSSHGTLSSGQKRPRPEMRNAISSPYL